MSSPQTFGLGTPSPYSTSPLDYMGGSPIYPDFLGGTAQISPQVSPLASPRLSGRRSGATSPRGSMYQSTQNSVASLPSLSGSPVSSYSASSAFLNSPVIANSGDMRMLQGGSVIGLPTLSNSQSNQGSYQQVQSYQPSELTLQQPSNYNQTVYDFGVDNGSTLRQQQQLPAEISRYSPGTQEFIRRVQQQVPNGQFSPGTLALLQGQQQTIQNAYSSGVNSLPTLGNTSPRSSGRRSASGTVVLPVGSVPRGSLSTGGTFNETLSSQQGGLQALADQYVSNQNLPTLSSYNSGSPYDNNNATDLADLANIYSGGVQQSQLPSLNNGSTSPRLSSKRRENLASDLQALSASGNTSPRMSPQMSPRMSPRLSGSARRQSSNPLSIQALPSLTGNSSGMSSPLMVSPISALPSLSDNSQGMEQEYGMGGSNDSLMW